MAFLHRLKISNVRNIRDAELLGFEQFNVLSGPNGAGKTSLLEAISFLGLGRSFRSRKARMVVNSQSDSLTVFGEISNAFNRQSRIGVRRSADGLLEIKVDGKGLRNTSSLARGLPLLIFNAEVFQLIEGGPSQRREYLDWILFHVEHQRFYDSWAAYHRALKQRNELLRRGNMSGDALAPWDAALIEHGQVLEDLRENSMQKLQGLLNTAGLLFEAGDLSVSLRRGWKEGVTLGEALEDALKRDLRYKTTTVGPHRMELEVLVGGLPAKDILSRGQIKMLASQLKLAAAEMVSAEPEGAKVLVLLDDLSAETDLEHRHKLLNDIADKGYQCFITGVFVDEVIKIIPDGIKKAVFHVEHGGVTKSSSYD